MSLNLNEQEFKSKYGFAIQDLYYACIDRIFDKSYWCYSIKELGYDIANKIYKELNVDNENNYILYKVTEDTPFNIKIKTHNIAFPYKDFYFVFDIRWTGNSLSVTDWDLKTKDELENDKGYTDIEEIFTEEVEENEQ